MMEQAAAKPYDSLNDALRRRQGRAAFPYAQAQTAQTSD
jgi:hypothetical protein